VEKGPDAFRTISEVADDLDLPQHVLRFWETRFPQIRPLKRGGGRRYYRPDDVELLRGIRHLLYGEGYTIRGVQRILKEEGPRYVQAIWREAEADAREAEQIEAGEALRHETADAGRRGGLSGILNLLPNRPREAEPDYLELPLLPEMGPQEKTPRQEPTLRAEPESAPEIHEPRQAFPFRAVAPEPVEDEDTDDAAYVPERARPAMPFRPVDDDLPDEPLLSRDDRHRLQAALQELQDCQRILDAARDREG
jgi:DNA-binding transcriptional MerR regulator